MDPDIPRPSVEGAGWSTHAPDTTTTSNATPLMTNRSDAPQQPKTPKAKSRSPSKTQTPTPSQRSPSVTSAQSERQSSPALKARHSLNNLKSPRSSTPSVAQFRRTSSNLNPSSPSVGSMPKPEHKALTPNEVAKVFFGKELEQQVPHSSEVVVIVHDSCYGHRFSRPRTTKAALSLIVERPERIQATVLGASLAYVRLGGRHADSHHPPHPKNTSPPDSAPFRIHKTTRNMILDHPAVTAVHGTKWMEELQIMCDTAEAKLAMNGKELVRPIGYGKDENGNSLPKLHEGDLYLCSESLAALQGCLGGVCEAIDTVFTSTLTKRAFVCIRPPGHHCSADFPSGFCWLNNVHVGITYAAMEHGLTHAAIIDFDLHHGDGSQMIAWNHNTKAKELPKHTAAHKRTPIGYYSLHDINSFPCEWGDEEKIRNASICVENAHGLSIWNVHLEEWKDHADFWRLYESRYMILLEKTRKFLRHHSAAMRSSGTQPKAAIFLSAGFDASEHEMAGMQRHGVSVPTEFYARFTSDVVKLSQEKDLGVDGRIISVLEGGYSNRALTSGVLSHVCGLVDEPVNGPAPIAPHGLGMSMSAVSGTSAGSATSPRPLVQKYNASWWDVHSLETIEAIVAGRLPPSKETTDKVQGNYSSPTQASSAKMTRVARERQSLNAEMEARLSLLERPIPPPPDVEWEIAAYELSRLIIPGDRQTASCRPDELNAEATRLRKERQSGVGVTAFSHTEPMQLRERKTRAQASPAAAPRSRSRTRSETRRTTISSFSDLPDPTEPVPPLPPNFAAKSRRRSSDGSSMVSGFSEMKLSENAKKLSSPRKTAAMQSAASGQPQVKDSKPAGVRKPRSVATKPPVPTKAPARKTTANAPALSRQTSNASDKASTILQQTSSNQSRQISGSSDASADLDSLTDAMKKTSIKGIKLKMPTKAQHDENLEKREEVQTKQTKTNRRSPGPQAPNANSAAAAAVVSAVPAAIPKAQTADIRPHDIPRDNDDTQKMVFETEQMSTIPRFEAYNIPVDNVTASAVASGATGIKAVTANGAQETTSSKSMLPPPPAEPAAPSPVLGDARSDAATFSTAPTTSQKQEAAHGIANATWNIHEHTLPHLPGAPSDHQFNFSRPPPPPPKSTSARPATPQKYQLPKFTSTSPIPFAKQPGTPAANSAPKGGSSAIWDLPDTPR